MSVFPFQDHVKVSVTSPCTGIDKVTVCAPSAGPPILGNVGTQVNPKEAPVAATNVPLTVCFVSVDVYKDSQMEEVAPQSASTSTSNVHCVVPRVAYGPPTVIPVMALSAGVSTADTIWSVKTIESTVRVIERPVITVAAAIILLLLQ
jgi:hypothetical protein